MSISHQHHSPISESRYLWANLSVIFILGVCALRLWYLQVYRGDYYRRISETNRIRRIEIEAPRGVLHDRFGTVILGNRPFFDLVYIPQYVVDQGKTLEILSRLLGEPVEYFERTLRATRGRPKFLPTVLMRNLSMHAVSLIESNRIFLPGVEINVAPRRNYEANLASHLFGYMGQISGNNLQAFNKRLPSDLKYQPGDLVGKHGIEKQWEDVLRGERGYRLIQVDAFGRETSVVEQEGWELPVKEAVPGADLVLTLDMALQQTVEKAFRGKNGAVIVMNPQSGEVLAMVSAPDYNPAVYQDGLSVDKWQSLISDPFFPLFDKATGGSFAPGSVYKPVVGLAALSENIVQSNTKFRCHGSLELGRDVFHCYKRSGHGNVALATALLKSCDVYFYNTGLELGADRIAKYARDLGLGRKYGIRLNQEESGLIPDSTWIRKTAGRGWLLGEIPNLAIGQGANLLTPVQIAVLYAAIANGGQVWRPFLVQKAVNHLGQTILEHRPELIHQSEYIRPEHFAVMRKMLEGVVMSPEGTGRNARLEGVTVAGKTGSVQVVGLNRHRNRKGKSVSMKWQEHAMFAAFSPTENAEIVVAVVSQNDTEGGGGASAAPVAKKILKHYWELKKIRQKQGSKNLRNVAQSTLRSERGG